MVVVTKEIECIVQDNVRYCEKEEISSKETLYTILWIMPLFIMLIIALIMIERK